VMASEVGVLDLDPATVVKKGRLQPGKMFLVDTTQGRIVDDEEIKRDLASQQPYGEWLHAGLVHLTDLPPRFLLTPQHSSVVKHQRVFGYTTEEIKLLLAPMARSGAEVIGSMGTDTPIATLSGRPRLLFDYFTQLFAQVTNPPLDAIREELVTSLSTTIGPEGNLLEPTPASCRQITLPFPVIDNDELAKIIHINDDGDLPGFAARVIRGLYPVAGGGAALQEALEDIRRQVSESIAPARRCVVRRTISDVPALARMTESPDTPACRRAAIASRIISPVPPARARPGPAPPASGRGPSARTTPGGRRGSPSPSLRSRRRG